MLSKIEREREDIIGLLDDYFNDVGGGGYEPVYSAVWAREISLRHTVARSSDGRARATVPLREHSRSISPPQENPMNIVSLTLEQGDLATLVAALELAAEKYRECARVATDAGQPHMIEAFTKQTEICERLRKMIGNVHGY